MHIAFASSCFLSFPMICTLHFYFSEPVTHSTIYPLQLIPDKLFFHH